MVKAIYERQFLKLRNDEIYVVAKRWFDGIQPVRGWSLSSRFVLALLIIFVFVDTLISGAQDIIPLSVYVAISLAQLTILLWLGTRKVKPKIVEEKPPNQLVFTAVTTRLTWPSKVKVSILNSSVKMEFSIFGAQLVAMWIERGWESLSSNLWKLLEEEAKTGLR